MHCRRACGQVAHYQWLEHSIGSKTASCSRDQARTIVGGNDGGLATPHSHNQADRSETVQRSYQGAPPGKIDQTMLGLLMQCAGYQRLCTTVFLQCAFVDQ